MCAVLFQLKVPTRSPGTDTQRLPEPEARRVALAAISAYGGVLHVVAVEQAPTRTIGKHPLRRGA